jgi:hypothetical protein
VSLVARSRLLFCIISAAPIRNNHIRPKGSPYRYIAHVSPFYNKSVSQHANVDNKIETTLKKSEKVAKGLNLEFKMQIAGGARISMGSEAALSYVTGI